jgi:hypothetical protein
MGTSRLLVMGQQRRKVVRELTTAMNCANSYR